MSVVQLMSNELWSYYERAKESSFSIGPGKMFMASFSHVSGVMTAGMNLVPVGVRYAGRVLCNKVCYEQT